MIVLRLQMTFGGFGGCSCVYLMVLTMFWKGDSLLYLMPQYVVNSLILNVGVLGGRWPYIYIFIHLFIYIRACVAASSKWQAISVEDASHREKSSKRRPTAQAVSLEKQRASGLCSYGMWHVETKPSAHLYKPWQWTPGAWDLPTVWSNSGRSKLMWTVYRSFRIIGWLD
jgi:hypothetical protein